MDISKLKDIIQRLNILKRYSSLLVPVVIAVVAVFLFIPTQLISSRLRKQIATESISRRGKKIKSLSRSAVPSEQWRVEEKYQEDYERDANKVALLAKQSTQRELLSYKIFPEPKDTSTLIFKEFGRQFHSAVDELITRVNARDCPTEAELERNFKSYSPGSPRRGRRGRGSLKISSRNLSEVEAMITDALCRARAESASVYANPADLSGYESWGEYKYDVGMKESVEDCWYGQLAYWIIEDVIDTIGALNSGSNSVFTSPVKRLLFGSFTTSTSEKRSKKKEADDKPSYVLSIKEGLAESCTGRICNEDIDVVHFNMAVVVGTKAVLPFMRQLCSAKQHKFKGFFGKEQEQIFKHNQITILESHIEPIDLEDDTHSLYRYGEDAVVKLDLVCEYILNKNGYDEIKPESVRKLVNGEL